MSFIIEQFPKNKDIDVNLLNEYQIFIRNNQRKYKYGKSKTCSKCFKKQPIKEFYVKDKVTGRRSRHCRDCQMREADIIEIGKFRFSKEILKKGFRRCSICKEIKPLSEYSKSKGNFAGHSNSCYVCSSRLHGEYISKQKEEIGVFYIRQYGIRKGITDFTDETIEQLRDEIIENRKPKHFLDDKEFFSDLDFSSYLLEKYDIPITTTQKRISKGVADFECTIKENAFRSLKSGCNKGRIKVTDTVTSETFYFFNTRDENLLKMFSDQTISIGLKTGLPVGGKRSKYKHPCMIERITNSFEKTESAEAKTF